MAKKMSISKDAHDLYVFAYGDDYDESVYPSIRSMTAVIATNASRIMDKTPTYHPWKMTYRNFYMAYTDGRFTMNGAEIPVPLDDSRSRKDLARPEIIQLREELIGMLRKQVAE